MSFDTLPVLGTLASHLDDPEFIDTTSPADRRALRKAADEFGKSLEEITGGPLSAPVLAAFCAGASSQATMAGTNPIARILATTGLAEASMDGRLAVVVAYLARDVLAGRRVE